MRTVKKRVQYWCDNVMKNKYLGQGVCVAVLDTGVAMHPELTGKILAFYDAVNGYEFPYDDSGHGTHVSGIVAGKQIGMAPEAKLVVCKVLDSNGEGKVPHLMKAIRWVLENQERYVIRIVNISAGMSEPMDPKDGERILAGVESLWDAGIVVVTAAGNRGPGSGTITIPGVSKKVITVGALSGEQRGKGYSGQGPTKDCVCKPDVLAPGTNVFSCNAKYSQRGERAYISKSGTSMATPVVSGAIATLLSKYPDMSNVETKLRLRESCIDLHLPRNQQGWGLLNVEKLLE